MTVGTIWWVLLTVLVVIGLFWSVDRFRPIFATICFLGYVAVLQLNLRRKKICWHAEKQ